jgi:hypothetical protein
VSAAQAVLAVIAASSATAKTHNAFMPSSRWSAA